MAEPLIAEIYTAVQARLAADLRADPGVADTPVAACPGWTVKGVVSHLAAIADDALAGRLAGVPSDEQTAQQVADRAATPLVELLDGWAEKTPALAERGAAAEIWPLALDILTHEFDIRAAIGDTSHRSGPLLEEIAGRVGQNIDVGRPVRVETETQTIGDGDLVLRTTDFEIVRARFGRRSAAQLAAMDWSEPVTAADAARLCIFGPNDTDIVE